LICFVFTSSAIQEKPGFYPAGGGRFRVSIKPGCLNGINLIERGNIINKTARATVAKLPVSIANRELRVICEKLDWEIELLGAEEVQNSQGPGNVLTAEIESENITEVFTGFGEKGVSAESVAKRIVKSIKEYLACNVPVGRYLADQILVPMALAGGGKFRTLSPTRHAKTNVETIKKFLDVEISVVEYGRDQWEFEIINKQNRIAGDLRW
jgi:RNA 3'-terminal phosphate cyclase (ATP)